MHPATFNESTGLWEQTVPKRDWYSIREVCTILNTGGPSVRNSIKRGTLKGHKVNGVAKVKHENLVAYIQRRGAVADMDEAGLVIEEIIPEKKRSQAAVVSDLTPGGALSDEDLSFLDEADEDEDEDEE